MNYNRDYTKNIFGTLLIMLLVIIVAGARPSFASSIGLETVPIEPTEADINFLETIRLPWVRGDKEDRKLTGDHINHAAKGFALDFGKNGGGYIVEGTAVISPANGYLTCGYVKSSGQSYGYYGDIKVDGFEWTIKLAHLKSHCGENRPVKTGHVIGYLGGTSGNIDSPYPLHIHLEILWNINSPNSGKFTITNIKTIFGKELDYYKCPVNEDGDDLCSQVFTDELFKDFKSNRWPSGGLTGHVFDSFNKPIDCAIVYPVSGGPSVWTDQDGEYTLTDVRIGSWRKIVALRVDANRKWDEGNTKSWCEKNTEAILGSTYRFYDVFPISSQGPTFHINTGQYCNASFAYSTTSCNPEQPPDTPLPNEDYSCENESQNGVYFYSDKNFDGRCYYTTGDIPEFVDNIVGNNNLSSIRVVGNYKAKIFEKNDYDGRYDILSKDDANLDIRSLGGQYSSAIVSVDGGGEDPVPPPSGSCPSDNSDGVYFYSNTDYGGSCYYSTFDVPNFGNTSVGNNDVSSIKIIGTWKVKIYEGIDYDDRYDLIHSSDPNLNIRSLGNQYSSAKITSVLSLPPIEIVKNLADNSQATYLLDTCPDGKVYYVDRPYSMTQFYPESFDGVTCIRTSNDDEASGTANLISFDLLESAYIYIYLDSRTTVLPGWMQNRWTNTGGWIKTLDEDMRYFHIYECTSLPGKIILGGMTQGGGAGAGSNYIVGIKPITNGSANIRCSGDGELPSTISGASNPSGIIYESAQSFQWDEDTNATEYDFKLIDEDGNIYYPEVYSETDICNGVTCAVELNIPYGDYSWQVRPNHEDAIGNWSSANEFKIAYPKAQLISPIRKTYNLPPSYRWYEVAGATEYLLVVKNGQDENVIWTTLSHASACSDYICSVTVNKNLGSGDYSWNVLSRTAANTNQWSFKGEFVLDILTPATSVLISPLGSGVGQIPEYSWSDGGKATQYLLVVKDANQSVVTWKWRNAEDICSDSTCLVNPGKSLGAGNYSWWVKGRNLHGDSIWSSTGSFTVEGTPAQPGLNSPVGTITDQDPSYSWEDVYSAEDYLLVVKEDGTDVVTWLWKSAVEICSAGTCSVDPGKVLGAENYSWWILPKNASGNGFWSLRSDFTIEGTSTQPILNSPVGITVEDTPEFNWEHVYLTTQYLLVVKDSLNNVEEWTTYNAVDICAGSICTVTPLGLILDIDSYTWQVLPKNSFGNGFWSLSANFTVLGE